MGVSSIVSPPGGGRVMVQQGREGGNQHGFQGRVQFNPNCQMQSQGLQPPRGGRGFLFEDEMEYDFTNDRQDYWALFRGGFHRAPYARPRNDAAWEARRADIF